MESPLFNLSGQQLVPSAETYTSIVVSGISEDKMEAFYASIGAEPNSLSSPLNTASVRNRPTETQKALRILRDLVTKKFSLLLHPGRSISMKDNLKYLLSFSRGRGVSWRTKYIILKLSACFAEWSLDYDKASLKLESTVDLSKSEKVKGELEANVKEFWVEKAAEKCLCDKLACLQEKKRKLEEEINATTAEIADFEADRDKVAKRKKQVFDIGRLLKAKRDDLRNQGPRLKAEQELAMITQANIEAEWSKLGEQFIESISSEEWM